MKKITSILCTLLITVCSFAQFEWAGPGKDISKYVLTNNEGHIVLRDSFFTALDSVGTVLFKTNPPISSDQPFVVDVFELLDSTYVYIVGEFTIIGTFHTGIRYNNSWISNMNHVYTPGSEMQRTRGIAFDDNSIISYVIGEPVFSDNLARVPYDGWNNIWIKNYGEHIFRDLTVFAGQIFICTDEGLWVLNEAGDFTAQHDGYVFDRIKLINDASLLVQKSDSLIRISQDLDLLDTVIITNGHLQDFDVRFGKVGVLTTTKQYYIYDESLNEVENFQLSNSGLEFTHTQVGDDVIYVAGNCSFGQAPYGSDAVFVKAYGLDGLDNAPQKDAGIVNITHGQQVTVFPTNWVLYDSVIITVMNFGSSPINSIYLNAGYWFPSTTEDFTKSQTRLFEISPIAPGSAREIVWEDLYLSFLENPTGPFTLCMWTSLPDNGLDINSANDVGCADFFVNTDEVLPEGYMMIYPNPANDKITLKTGMPMLPGTTWNLFDQFGRAAVQADIPNNTQAYSIKLPDIPAGLYLWRLANKEGLRKSGKLVISK